VSVSPPTPEREVLDELERRLTGQGYVVHREPRGEALPTFLRSFQPDAIATGKDPNLLIEVITRRGAGAAETTKARQLQQLLDGHADWRLEVVYATSSTPLPAVAPLEAIRRRFAEVEGLAAVDPPAALVAAWSVLEAVARRMLPDRAVKALTPATTVELLTSLGHLSQAEADTLRAAIRTRNLVVHGDIGAPVSGAQLAVVLAIVNALIAQLERQAAGEA
jgi:hypothetical protein